MSRPTKFKEPTRLVGFTCPRSLQETIDREAKRRGHSRSEEVARALIAFYLGDYLQPPPREDVQKLAARVREVEQAISEYLETFEA